MKNSLEIIQSFRNEHDAFWEKRFAYKEKIKEQFIKKEYGRIQELYSQLLMLDYEGNPVSEVIYEFRSKQNISLENKKKVSLNEEFEALKEEALIMQQEELNLRQKDEELIRTLLQPLLEKEDEDSKNELKVLFTNFPTTTAKYRFYKLMEQKIKPEDIYTHLQRRPQNS